MSRPPVFGNYERVPFNDFVKGIIEEVQEEPEHEFPVFKESGGKYIKTGSNKFFGIRFKYNLEGCEKSHYSRWMKFLYSERANLYTKYLSSLVEGAKPDMDFDIQQLKGMEVKTLWDNKPFQGLVAIMPLKSKIVPEIKPEALVEDTEDDHGIVMDEEEEPKIPF